VTADPAAAPPPTGHADSTDLTRRALQQALALGFESAGVAELRDSDHAAFYRAWLERGLHGDMRYLEREDAVRTRLRPATAWPGLRSAIVVALHYAPTADESPASADRGIIARYARGRDYHRVLKKKLLALLGWLEAEVGHELPAARAYVDTGPVLERELARRAGLGWFGRNTMLIDPRRGSYFFIGALLTELELAPSSPFDADRCGTCSRCVSACPTGALLGRNAEGAPVIDATRCISYLTIENRGAIPRALRPMVGNRVYGCDICQEVCPWNAPKLVQLTREGDFDGRERERERLRERLREGREPLPGTTGPSLIALMRMTYEEWDAWTRGSAIRRAGYAGLRRNVAVALGNWGAEEAVPVLVEALGDAESLVRGHAAWALGEIPAPTVSAALAERLSGEDDAWVREELELALARRCRTSVASES
jgi:epoxyqueuosine reductase